MSAAWRSLVRETWSKAVVVTNFACLYSCFTNYICEVTMVRSKPRCLRLNHHTPLEFPRKAYCMKVNGLDETR